ncbi:MAG: hypothetical protein V7609_1826 [Verrucomicrobiota bacterium]
MILSNSDSKGAKTPTCFVIMPFGAVDGVATAAEWTSIFEDIIRPAVETAGHNYVCTRSSLARGNVIKDIVESLSSADAVVADLSGRKPNVFYELGVRHALVGRTILVAQRDDDIPSDLRNYAYHIYDFRTDSGRQNFARKIAELLSELTANPEKPDNPVQDFILQDLAALPDFGREKFPTSIQSAAAREEAHRYGQAIGEIRAGRIPLKADATSYFQAFVETMNANTACESVHVFARLLNLEVQKNLKRFGFMKLFPGLRKAVAAGKLEIEYLVFLRSPGSENDPDAMDILQAYSEFAREVTLLFESDAHISSEDTRETFVLLNGHHWVLTHGWQYSGELTGPRQWILEEDYRQFVATFERLKRSSRPYFVRPT